MRLEEVSVLGGVSLSLVEGQNLALSRVTERLEKLSPPPKHPPGLLHVVPQLVQVPGGAELRVEKPFPLLPEVFYWIHVG